LKNHGKEIIVIIIIIIIIMTMITSIFLEQIESVLEELTQGRIELAHPTTIDPSDENCPSPKDLEDIINTLY